MPRGDGTGPAGQFQGRGQGGRRGMGRRFGAGGRMGGFCICPSCGEKIPHQQGTPCRSVKCPKCSIQMVRA